MTDLEVMRRAKMYLDQMANGVNPLTGYPVPEGELLNNVRISRCLFYVSDILRQVIENGGTITRSRKLSGPRRAFTITPQELTRFPFSDKPLKITEIVRRINELSNREDMKRLQPVNITEYLQENGFMELCDNGRGKQIRLPTEAGYSIGLTAEDRVAPNGQSYTAVFYSRNAQRFIIDNMEAVLLKLYGNDNQNHVKSEGSQPEIRYDPSRGELRTEGSN